MRQKCDFTFWPKFGCNHWGCRAEREFDKSWGRKYNYDVEVYETDARAAGV